MQVEPHLTPSALKDTDKKSLAARERHLHHCEGSGRGETQRQQFKARGSRRLPPPCTRSERDRLLAPKAPSSALPGIT